MNGDYTVVGDPHLTPKTLDRGARLFNIVEELGNPVIWLGDLQDTKEIVRSKVLNAYYDYFKSSKLNHIILVGNHDWHNLECLDHSLKTLGALPHVKIVDKPTNFGKFLCVPYYKDTDKLRQILKDNSGARTLICHVDISGFDYGNGALCEDGLSLEDFKSFGLVISGHFHKHQVQNNLIYLGSPFSHSFGETDQHKFLGIYNENSNQIACITSQFPRHVTLKLNLSDGDYTLKLIQFMGEHSNDIVRVQLYGNSVTCASFDRTPYKDKNIKFEDKSESEEALGVDIDESLDNKTQFMIWAKDVRNLDQETINLGVSILEALSVKRN